ncbi:Coiled-coil domain-containing protein 83 [Varanus komodoensis]|nr:Coiled-coil domain-containing protein 83 [Varanus komodoensis]
MRMASASVRSESFIMTEKTYFTLTETNHGKRKEEEGQEKKGHFTAVQGTSNLLSRSSVGISVRINMSGIWSLLQECLLNQHACYPSSDPVNGLLSSVLGSEKGASIPSFLKLSAEELRPLNCGAGGDSCESLGLQGDQTGLPGSLEIHCVGAFLFRIQIKEEIIDQLLYDIKTQEAKNDRCKERNQHLKEEQIGHIRALLTSLKEQEKELEKIEIVTRDDVEKAMKEKWQYVKDQDKLIKDVRLQIHYVEQKLLRKQTEVDYWLAYKNVGSTEHAKQIEYLEMDIKKLKEDLEEMTEFFRLALEETKEKIDKSTLRQMEQKKEWATENAVKHIDKISCREIKEYEWLKEEASVAAYRKEVSLLEDSIHELEAENIYLINKLFEYKLQFLRVPSQVACDQLINKTFTRGENERRLVVSKLFLTQGAGLQMPGEGSLREQGSPYAGLKSEENSEAAIPEVLPAVQKGSGSKTWDFTVMEEGLEDEEDVVDLQGHSATGFLPPILYEDANDFKEYKDLGSLEVKLMTIVGQAMPIHEDIKEMPSKTQLEEKYDASRSPRQITYQMIKSVFP